MAIKKQLKDKDGNTIYPDVGIDLGSVVYSDDPTETISPEPWIDTGDIKDNAVTNSKIDYSTIDFSASGGNPIGYGGNSQIKMALLSGTSANAVGTWKNIGNIGTGKTALGMIGAFQADGSWYFFPGGTNTSEMTGGYYNPSNGNVSIRSSFDYALNRNVKILIWYM